MMGFRTRVALLGGMVFVLASLSGMIFYATGEQVVADPLMSMVSHTEYRFNESGQVIARIVDFRGDPVSVSSCNATILYPDKSVLVSMAGMTASAIAGDFYYNFTTPVGPEGTYEYQAICFYGVNKNASVTNSFHLSSALTSVLGNLSSLNVSVDLSSVTSRLDVMNVTLSENNAYLVLVNATTTSTYDYLTGSLTSKVDDVLTQLGIINATVNRIEANTNNINTTVNLIKENQENAVVMQVFSG